MSDKCFFFLQLSAFFQGRSHIWQLRLEKELVDGYGVYAKFVKLEQAEQCSKNTATGLMRAIMGCSTHDTALLLSLQIQGSTPPNER